MISAINTSVIPLDSVTMTPSTIRATAKMPTDDAVDGHYRTGSVSKSESKSVTESVTDRATADLIEFEHIPVIAIQSPTIQSAERQLRFKGLSAVRNTSALMQKPAALLLKGSNREWVFEDRPSGESSVLTVSGGNMSYYAMNSIAFLMVILAVYQLVIDTLAFYQYVHQHHGGGEVVGNQSFYDYQCYAVIITNSPSFKQIFIILACLVVGRMNAVIFVKHLV